MALWQTDHVSARMEARWPGVRVERVPITTLGDRVTNVAISKIGDKGIFTRELEDALRAGSIDLAVHSLKDCRPKRPRDCASVPCSSAKTPRRAGRLADATIATLSPGARVGTSSLRRRAQLATVRPDVEIVDIRGNVPTRLDKVWRGDVNAVLLALAGLKRLGMESHVSQVFDPDELLPAPGQGALAVQIRGDDEHVASLVATLDHTATRVATTAERALLGFLEGGCQVPVGALAEFDDTGSLVLRGVVASLEGLPVIRRRAAVRIASVEDAKEFGESLGRELLEAGGREILNAIRAAPLSRAALEESAS